MLIGVLGLQGDYREHQKLLNELGVESIKVRRASELEKVDALIIPGGESTAMSNLAKSFGLFPALRDFAKAKPVLGTCAGMIMLADDVEGSIPGQEFIGGLPIKVSRNAYGGQTHSFESEVDFGTLKEKVAFIRAPRILDSSKVEVLATLNGEAVAVRSGHLFGASFHPEITGSKFLHNLFLEHCKIAKD
ncbi:MAG: pyridoxal 5'-phosphate synthase glutaminase subunit PdxT [Aquiluna sp.]|nr:pyridoxal 5'-phosphate synthase glutaminase subunit PdxT [Aquiluna sp.]MCF8545107.1 pyridoxal 5'-phosphate synthase glutaminase subunit PdxT [Aquiluna sp.]